MDFADVPSHDHSSNEQGSIQILPAVTRQARVSNHLAKGPLLFKEAGRFPSTFCQLLERCQSNSSTGMESFDFPSSFLYGVSLDINAPFRPQVDRHSRRDPSWSTLWSDLIGTWQLASHFAFAEDDPDDKLYPLGPDAQGILIYTTDGYMSCSLLRPGQEPFSSAETGGPSQAALAEATKRYLGYAGPYFIKTSGNAVTVFHHLQLANFPHWTGNLQTRRMDLDGDTLTLGLESFVDVGGVRRHPLLVWTKMSQNDPKMTG